MTKSVVFIALTLCYLNFSLAETIESCNSTIYCQGELLHTVQNARLFPDSKTFVDMKLIKNAQETLNDFNEFMDKYDQKPTKDQIQDFVDAHFSSVSELDDWRPDDFIKNPEFLKRINDLVVREFARSLVYIWPNLGRKMKAEVLENPEQYSSISIPNGFIVPGGRFKELYYWDSLWIIKGLLISEMPDTVKGMLENFLSIIDRYGFIPNGARVYYLNRSQPPLFTQMVHEYIKHTNNIEWLKKNIESLAKELKFFLDNKTITVKKNGEEFTLAHYDVESGTPRPESYYEDYTNAQFFQNEEDQVEFYKNIKSGAESGWDFSSRWFFDQNGGNDANLSFVDTRRVIPVDLNAFLCKDFEIISNFYETLGDEDSAKFWQQKNEAWKTAIQKVFYDEEDGIWYDYDNKLGKNRKEYYPSNLSPLYCDAYNNADATTLGDRAANYLIKQNITDFNGGIPTSLIESGEQWDYPNAWPPLQSIVIFGLEKSGSSDAQKLARAFSKTVIKGYIRGFAETKEMFEKYDALHSGKYGGGGEYKVQSGFGWTNGAALEIINHFFTK